MANLAAVSDLREGRKLTDDIILPLLRIIRSNTGVQFVEPAVLMGFEFADAVFPDLSRVSRAMLIIHLGVMEDVGHWVLTTFENGVVNVYDSMNSMTICPQLRVTVQRVFGRDKPIHTVPVATPQANDNDCGVLASAYAVDWALGYNPAVIKYEYAALRVHLLSILRDGALHPFPRLLQVAVSMEVRQEPVAQSLPSVDEGEQHSVSERELHSLMVRVLHTLRTKYGVRVLTFPICKSKVHRYDRFMGLCHINVKPIDYYSIMAYLPERSSDTCVVYDFCGRRHVSHLSKKEVAFQVVFSSQVNLAVKSAPCRASRTDPAKSLLLSLMTMLYLATNMDPLLKIQYDDDVASLKQSLLSLIDYIEADGDQPEQAEQAQEEPEERQQQQQQQQDEEEDSEEDIPSLKLRVLEKLEQNEGILFIEYPMFPRNYLRGEYLGLLRVVNAQRANDYYAVQHCPLGEDTVMIHDFCGRTYSRDILKVEKQFAGRALCKPGVRCKLMRYPTLATKKDTEKCLLYSLLTLLCLAERRSLLSVIDQRSDVNTLRLTLMKLLKGEAISETPDVVVRPLYQRRRSATDLGTDLGTMNVQCYSCGAKYFPCEVHDKSGPQMKCCKMGRITLPRRRDTPEVLRRLMMEDSEESKHFRALIYRYNCALAFASIHAQCPNLGQGAQAFIVQGQMYTTMYPGMPGRDGNPRGNQMYFLDIEQGVASRVDSFSGIRPSVVRALLEMLRDCNPYAGVYATMCDYVQRRDRGEVARVNLAMRADLNALHRGTGGMPTSDEVVVVYTPTDDGQFGSMVVYSVPGDVPQKVNLNSPSAEPMLFPLLSPRGECGYLRNLQPRITFREYCTYLLARRDEFSTFKYGGRLKQAYLCFVCLKIEDDRLSWIANNQSTLRAELYKGLHDWVNRRAEEAHARVGRVVVLPATFTGGPRYMHRKYLDALAAVCHFGRYDLFITITTNPRWREISDNIPPGQTLADNCDLVNRVFQAKLFKFFDLIEKQQILGDVAAWLYVIEFQKRGLPHAHCVAIFTPQYSVDTAGRVDELITAEIPEEEGEERELVLEFMLHEPCRSRPSAKCRSGVNNACRHDFPKDFNVNTVYGGPDQRTAYRRRPSKKPGTLHGQTVDNDYVVPTNLKLLKALRCHVNVEVFQPMLGVKYLFKYLQKGESRDTIQIRHDVAGEPAVAVNDEVRHYQAHRYLSCYEADWRLRALNITDCSHTVLRLSVHLPSEQMVYFVEGGEEDALRIAGEKRSHLEAWFELNRTDSFARSLRYVEVPVHYVWDVARRTWQRRQKRGERMIVRMYDVSPSCGELFYLRLILLHNTGAVGYEDLKTVCGVVYETFREACQAMGLLSDDLEYVRCLTDAVNVKSAASLRRLFVQILSFGAPANPRALYDRFFDDMADDYKGDASDELARRRHVDIRLRASLDRLGYDFVSADMDFLLSGTGYAEELFNVSETTTTTTATVAPPGLVDQGRALEESFNEGQRMAYDAVMAAVRGGRNSLRSRVFFLDGAAGTGKTHLLNAMTEIVEARIEGSLVVSMAWSGLAASILRRGRTVHSTLKLPFAMDDSTKVGVSFQSCRADIIRDSPLIIWDEISMSHVKAFTAFDEWLRLLMGSNRPFGDKVVVFAGDFRQILPVVPGQDPSNVVRVIVKNSVLWRSVECLRLWQSMRVSHEEREFSEFLLGVGEGTVPVPRGIPVGSVVIPRDVLCTKRELAAFVRHPDVSAGDAIILCVRNSDVDDINSLIARTDLQESTTYLSSDMNAYADDQASGAHTDPEYRHNLPIEYLNRLNPPSMPPHRLTLKVGQPVMLLRNLDVAAGLCNGKRLIVAQLRKDLVVCSRADSTEPVLLCRHRFTTLDTRDAVPFVRLQYPIKLAYACTVHKSQGQTLSRVGVYLRHSVFTHGMLYVAMSRVRRRSDLRICIEQGDGQGTVQGVTYTRNVVFQDALQ